jgi:hypothetical protein
VVGSSEKRIKRSWRTQKGSRQQGRKKDRKSKGQKTADEENGKQVTPNNKTPYKVEIGFRDIMKNYFLSSAKASLEKREMSIYN